MDVEDKFEICKLDGGDFTEMSLIEVVFSRMHSEGFSFYFGGLGVELCSLDAAFASATVRNRSR
jgi:hypothetical protein